MSTESIVAFNKEAHNFLTNMCKTFPDEIRLRSYRLTFDTLLKHDFRQPVRMFMESLEPYGLEILTKDEAYFKDPLCVGAVETLTGKLGLVDYWDKMSQGTQTAIWDYFQVLYVHGMKALGKEAELGAVVGKAKAVNAAKGAAMPSPR